MKPKILTLLIATLLLAGSAHSWSQTAPTVTLAVPVGTTPSTTVTGASGTPYSADALGHIVVQDSGDVRAFLSAGFSANITSQVYVDQGSPMYGARNRAKIQAAVDAGGTVLLDCKAQQATETYAIPSSAPYPISVVNAGPFYSSAVKIVYAGTNIALTKVTGTPAPGQYVDNQGGQFLFSSTDTGSVSITYNWLPPFYVGGHIALGSNTDLEHKYGCYWTQPAGTNDNLLTTKSFDAPWNTGVQFNNGLAAVGPQFITWDGSVQLWAASQTLKRGQMVYYNGGSGNTYITYYVANNCVTATGGGPPATPYSGANTGPAGTYGAAITNGSDSCQYYYMFARYVQNDMDDTATIYLPNHGRSAGQAIWIGPQPDNVAVSYQWYSGTQAAQSAGGPLDGAYIDVFPIVAVLDQDHFVVVLPRTPNTLQNGSVTNLLTITDTSTSTVTVGTGSKTFTVSAGKAFFAGESLVIQDQADPTHYVHGTVTSYSGTTLVLNSLDIGGAATSVSAWNISPSNYGGAFSGVPMQWKMGVQNVKVAGGGTFDCNGVNNIPALALQESCVVMAGVQNLTMQDLYGLNSYNLYDFQLSGIEGATIDHVQGSPSPSNTTLQVAQLAIYGPAHNILVRRLTGSSTDDILALATSDRNTCTTLPNHCAQAQIISSGDISDVTVDMSNNIGGAGSVTLWALQQFFMHDRIHIIMPGAHQAQNAALTAAGGGRGYANVRFFGPGTSTLNGHFGSVTVDLPQEKDCLNSVFDTSQTTGSITIDLLTINQAETKQYTPCNSVNPGQGLLAYFNNTQSGSTQTVHKIVCNNCEAMENSTSGSAAINMRNGGGTVTIDDVDWNGGYVSNLGAAGGFIVFNQSSTNTLTHVSVRNARINNLAAAVDQVGSGTTIDLENDNFTNTAAAVFLSGNDTVRLSHNILNAMTNVVHFVANSPTATVYSDGENTWVGATGWETGTGTIVGYNLVDAAETMVPQAHSASCPGFTAGSGMTMLGGPMSLTSASTCELDVGYTSNGAYASPPRICHVDDLAAHTIWNCAISWTSPTNAQVTLSGSGASTSLQLDLRP